MFKFKVDYYTCLSFKLQQHSVKLNRVFSSTSVNAYSKSIGTGKGFTGNANTLIYNFVFFLKLIGI